MAEFEAKLDTQKEAEDKFRKNDLQSRIAERNLKKQEELKYGKEVSELKSFFRKEEVQGVKDATSQLAQLQNSRNSTLKGIGKAAARVQAAIKTAEGAIGAYAALAGIPIVGPALGAGAAIAITAYGVEQQQKISAAQGGGFAGGAVAGVGRGSIDSQLTLTNPNELNSS